MKKVKSLSYHNVTGNGKRDGCENRKKRRDGNKVKEKLSEDSPKFPVTSLCTGTIYPCRWISVQRSVLNENVEPQASGGRKKPLQEIGWTYDLHTFCNGSDMESTMQYMSRIY